MEQHQRTLIAVQGYCELTMYDDALAELDSLPAEVHHHPMVVEMRLVTLMQARRWPPALEAARELCRLRPDASTGFIHAAFCEHELGDTAQARRTLLESPEHTRRESNFHYNMACYEYVLGNGEAARKYLAASIVMDPKYRDFAKTDPDLRGLDGGPPPG